MQNAKALALVVLLGSLQAACGDTAAVVGQTPTGPKDSANRLAEGYHMTAPGTLDVRAFGAVGDGSTDDTAALQKAIDAAAQQQATVLIPAGVYRCSTLTLRAQMGLLGRPAFSYRANGGTILKLNDPNARCLLDMTSAIGATVEGLCLDGNEQMGQDIHGILVDKEDYGRQEDAFRIERCRISNFSGHGILLSRIWCFSVRHCMVCFNKGNGIRIRGWDGFVLDNWLSGNGDAGYGAYDENSAVTITANRIEWNGHAGIEIHGGSHYNITGNYVDRSSGPAVKLMPRDQTPCRVITITGNVIYRSGAPHRGDLEPLDSSHLRFEGAEGLVCTGNTFTVGRDDGGKGKWSPEYGIVCRKLADSVIKDNVLWHGAMKAVLHDLGQHGPNVIIRDNVGSPMSLTVGEDDWMIRSGYWQVQDGRIHGTSDQNGYLCNRSHHEDDVRIRAALRAGEGQEISLWFAGSDDKADADGYFVSVKPETAVLQRKGQVALGADAPVAFRPGKNYTLTVERTAGRVRAWLEQGNTIDRPSSTAQPFLDWTDPEPLRGVGHRTWGFYVWNGAVVVLDYKIEAR